MVSIASTRRGFIGASAAAAAMSLAPRRSRAAELQKVRIITTSGNLTWEEILRQKRYMEELGIEAETIHVSDGTKIIGSLLNGESDIAIATGFNQLFPAMERGAKLKLLAGGIILGQQTIYSSRSNITKVADLAGKTVGIGSLGAQLHQIMVALLRKKGVDPAQVNFVNIGSSTDIFKAVAAGTIDAGPGTIEVFPEQTKYGVHNLIDGNFWEQLPEYAFQASYASTRAIETKRDLLVRTLASYAKLYRYISAPGSKDVFVTARQKALGQTDAKSVAEGEFQWDFFQKYQIFATNLVLTDAQVRFQQDLNVSLDVQKTVLPFDEVADMSVARDAIKLIGG